MPLNARASQSFVPVKDIRDGVLILKNNDMRMIMMTSSLNFGLKSKEEQAAIILQFQNFLNSLEFSIQIIIQSTRLDIRPYMSLLDEREKAQVSDLMKIQTREYIRFVKGFTEQVNIMSKTFLIVVPYSPKGAVDDEGRKKSSLFKKKSASDKVEEEKLSFEQNKVQMEQRVSVVEQGMARSGIRTTLLGTEEIVELFYKKFNPGEVGGAEG